jgi:hypothetical protein
MNISNCAICNDAITIACNICNSTHSNNYFKKCPDCYFCTNDINQYCTLHNCKYIINKLHTEAVVQPLIDQLQLNKLCKDCIINPNKKTIYCLRCDIRHHTNTTTFCNKCKSCLVIKTLNHIYKHCNKCNTCFLFRDEHNNLFECDNCIDSSSESNDDDEYELLNAIDSNFNYVQITNESDNDIYDEIDTDSDHDINNNIEIIFN